MDRQKINRMSGIIPIVLSLSAFGVVIAAVLTGWGKGYADEGASAHLFQLLIVAQVPFILVFVVTANWKRAPPSSRPDRTPSCCRRSCPCTGSLFQTVASVSSRASSAAFLQTRSRISRTRSGD